MKNVIAAVTFFFVSYSAFSQCLDYQYFAGIFEKDLESQYSYLESKGFKMEEGLKTENSVEWHNDETGQYINVFYFPSSPDVKMIRYQMIEEIECYDALKNSMDKLGYEKDTEMVENSGLRFYFVSDLNGVVLNKIPGDGFVNHVFELYDLDAYYLLFK